MFNACHLHSLRFQQEGNICVLHKHLLFVNNDFICHVLRLPHNTQLFFYRPFHQQQT